MTFDYGYGVLVVSSEKNVVVSPEGWWNIDLLQVFHPQQNIFVGISFIDVSLDIGNSLYDKFIFEHYINCAEYVKY